jgi:cation:H+ antiporter
MLLNVLLLIVGLAVLYFGAEFMVKGASQLALAFGVSPLIVGLTVVAFGTSAPELVISTLAAISGSTGISVGNIVGSNICNVALILGVAALIAPLAIDPGSLRREYPFMVIVSAVFFALAYDGTLDFGDGAILFVGIIGYVAYNIYLARRHIRAGRQGTAESAEGDDGSDDAKPDNSKNKKYILTQIAFLVAGLAGLTVGAQVMVDAAEAIAKAAGISEFIIGITIVALGTSLPELATSVVAAVRGESDISIGNVVGSNIFNILFVMGLVPMIRDIPVGAIALQVDFPVMLGVLVLAFPLLRHKYELGRVKGSILLVSYLVYVVYLFMR